MSEARGTHAVATVRPHHHGRPVLVPVAAPGRVEGELPRTATVTRPAGWGRTSGSGNALSTHQPAADQRPTALLEVAGLGIADSPRLAGEDPEHVRLLAGIEASLPPILVHLPTMRVIDGVHRLRAAQLRGDERIKAVFFDGDAEAAFVRAVEENTAHGLPLSLADREAAAARIVASHPHWSDRAIAAATGLAARTVAGIRSRATAADPRLHARLGRDGRVRPVDISTGRRRAAEFIRANPDASLRQVAKVAGVSPGTVRDVRERLRKGLDPVPAGARNPGGSVRAASAPRRLPDRVAPESQRERLRNLARDPALRHTTVGREVIRWLDVHLIGTEDWADLLDAVPPHCAYLIAEMALDCAAAWRELAGALERRIQATGEVDPGGTGDAPETTVRAGR